jgi:isopentenyldiphosphate isomerase
MPGESREEAIARRLQYELGMTAHDVSLALPNYCYKTPPFNGIIENEFCPVFLARTSEVPKPNPEEVAQYYWMEWSDFVTATEIDGAEDAARHTWMKSLPEGESRRLGIWSWWCKDQVKQLKHEARINDYLVSSSATSF